MTQTKLSYLLDQSETDQELYKDEGQRPTNTPDYLEWLKLNHTLAKEVIAQSREDAMRRDENPTLNDLDYAFAANECLGEWITEASRRVYTDEEKIGKIPIQQYLSEKATDSLRYKEATQATREFMDGTQASHAYEQYMYHSMLCEYIRIEMGDKESMDLDEIKEVEKLRLIHKNGSNIVNKQTTKRIDPICSLTYSPEQLSERDSNELPYLSSL
nr:hypothetical protein L203_03336 [Cryptococcus depauperatus CBS 7841]